MKKNIIFVLIIFLLIKFSATAQKKEIKFNSVNTFEMISGESPLNTGFQTINGVRFLNWFSGVGIGVDEYRYKTLPLFVDVRKFFGHERKAFFYGNVGSNFPLKNKPDKEVYYTSYHFTGGVYTDIGIGYQFYLSKSSSLVFSLGNSFKKLKIRTNVSYECGSGPCPENYTSYSYRLNRMILKAGLIF